MHNWLYAVALLGMISFGSYIGASRGWLARQLGLPIGGTANRVARTVLCIGMCIIAFGAISLIIKPSLSRSAAYFNWLFGVGVGLAALGAGLTGFTWPSRRELRRRRRDQERAERAKHSHTVT